MYRIIMRAKGVDTMKENAELSRRNFLKGSALALGGLVAAPTLLTGCAANPNDHLIPPKPSITAAARMARGSTGDSSGENQ